VKGRIMPSTMLALSLALLGAAGLAGGAQEEPISAGEGGVPKPKRTKTVKPEYPAEAQAQGIRGIVILQVTVDTQGKVASLELIRSVAGLDEAALTAARQWEYEVTKVHGKPVSVRFPEVITFALKLPEIDRQAGIPELRMGAAPSYPREGRGSAKVVADMTLDPSGQVVDAQILASESPFSEALIQALRTWRFATERTDEVLSFRLEASFVEGGGAARGRVDLSLSGLRRSEFSAPAPREASMATPAPEAAIPAPSPPATEAAPGDAPTPETADAPSSPSPPGIGASPLPPPVPSSNAGPAPATEATPPAAPPAAVPPAAVPPSPSPAVPPSAPSPPPVEVITAPPRPVAPVPEASGVSAIRGVTLEQNVPDLTRGRRPVPPPFARMGGTSGTVEVHFSVDAAGQSRVKIARGPEVLRVAAEDMVASWVFRRTTASRLHLVATIEYAGDLANATVKVEPEEPAPTPSPVPSPSPEASPSPASG